MASAVGERRMMGYQFKKGLVSVVTPVYNGASYLPQMLDSVLKQTYGQIEMILVDDGSEDDTVKVAEDYCCKFATRGYEYHIIRAEHQNASAALNRGLPYVTGEYLIWPDGDDVLEPESVKRRVSFLQENPAYQCVRTLSYYFHAEDGTAAEREEQSGDLEKEDLFWDMLEGRTFVCCGCYMLRSERFFEIYPNRHIPEYDVGQNFQMLLPFLFFHKCPTIQQKLYGVCCRKGSHSRRAPSREEEERKYQLYEMMVDEITQICGITDKKGKKRIQYWKIRRRYQLARKYGDGKRILQERFALYRCGGWDRFNQSVRDLFRRICEKLQNRFK